MNTVLKYGSCLAVALALVACGGESDSKEVALKKMAALKWDKAKAYCDNLDFAGYSDWLLPSFDNLTTLINHAPDGKPGMPGAASPLYPAFEFYNPQNSYWSSTPFDGAKNSFYVANSFSGTPYASKDTALAVRCVRNNGKAAPETSKEAVRTFIRDTQLNVVKDITNKLMWQDNANHPGHQ